MQGAEDKGVAWVYFIFFAFLLFLGGFFFLLGVIRHRREVRQCGCLFYLLTLLTITSLSHHIKFQGFRRINEKKNFIMSEIIGENHGSELSESKILLGPLFFCVCVFLIPFARGGGFFFFLFFPYFSSLLHFRVFIFAIDSRGVSCFSAMSFGLGRFF